MSSFLSINYDSPEWEMLPKAVRKEVRTFIDLFRTAPEKGITAWLEEQASILTNSGQITISYSTLRRKYDTLMNNGGDPMLLVDKRKVSGLRATKALTRQPRFIAELCQIVESYQRKNPAAFNALRLRWNARKETIPGYESWPGWPKPPAGWGNRNLSRIVEANIELARLRSIRVGTSSKSNSYLPTVKTTRVGHHPGSVIQLDDVWHDNQVTHGRGRDRKIVRVIELGALDLFSGCRFHWGAMPRRKREDGTWKTLGGSDMRLFLAGMFHRFGYSPKGTMLMSEHQTAKVSEDIARILYDATGGLIQVDYQPIEGKQAALNAFWPGTEGGNFRAKAALESIHNLIHNYLGHLALQTGSPSSGLKGPVTTDRAIAHFEKIFADVLKVAPHHLDRLQAPTLDFHAHFIPFLTDYYEHGLNGRTDHNLADWEELGHVVTEFTTMPDSDLWLPENLLRKLPVRTQQIIHSGAQEQPAEWTRRRKLSPAEVWNQRGEWRQIPPVVLCDILTDDLAREVTARRGFLEFSDHDIAPDPLIYQARFISGPRQGREIPHGEKIKMFALPFDDSTAIVVDARDCFLGEVPLYKKVLSIEPGAFGSDAPFELRPDIRSQALKAAAGEKHSRIADIMEPSRILHADKVRDAQDLREHNRKVINGEPVTPEEIHQARVSAGQQAHRTAAANRLQSHGEALDWDDVPAATAPVRAAWDDLPDDVELPDAL